MPTVKRILCLANSRKINGRCIAGLELDGTGARIDWIRPVSNRAHQEVSEYERQYEDGSDPRLLDIMDVPLIEPKPMDYQQENWLLDPDCYWHKIGVSPWSKLVRLVDLPGPLWTNGHSSYHGLNDRIPLVEAASLRSSLKLVHVDGLTLSIFSPGEAFGNNKRRVQARFRYQDVAYHLWVTDPVYERLYLAKKEGNYQIGESCLTVSLGEPYKDYCYKLVAAIMERRGGPMS